MPVPLSCVMDRACLLCTGTKKSLGELINVRQDSKEKDYMKYLFSIPIKDCVTVSALRLTPEVNHILPSKEFLHPGYCGEECRDLLVNSGMTDKFVICGIESPGCGYTTYDIVFPQGRCEKGESSRDAAIREFIEETGIKLDSKSKNIYFLGFVGKRKEMSVYMYKID